MDDKWDGIQSMFDEAEERTGIPRRILLLLVFYIVEDWLEHIS